MNTYHDFESLGWASSNQREILPDIFESFVGTQIVEWYGNIERQIQQMIQQAEGSRNWPYVDKLRQFLTTWRENQLDGSINLEVIKPLETATGQLAVDTWKFQNYFSNLRDQLRKLIASEQELPRSSEPLKKPSRPRPSSARTGPSPKSPPSEFGAEPTPGAPTPETAAAAAAEPAGGAAPAPGV